MDVTVWEKFRNLFLVINFPQRWPRKRLLSWTLCCLPTFTEFWRNIRQCGKLCAPLRFVTLDLIPAQISALLILSSYVWFIYILSLVMLSLIPSKSLLNFHYCTLWKKILSVVFTVSDLNFHMILNIANHQSDIFCKKFLWIWENLKTAEQSLKKTKFRQ